MTTVGESSLLTPMTTVGESSLAGAEKMIFLAPAAMWGATLSVVRKAPVDSQMYSAPIAPKGISDGSRVCVVGVRTPSILRPIASDLAMMRATRRPMRPKPLMPPATAMLGARAAAWGRVAAGRALPDVVNADAPEARRAAAVYFILVERCDLLG